MRQHDVHSIQDADDLEARDTEVTPLAWVRTAFTGPVDVGDGVIITARCGSTFLGKVVDVEDDRVYVELT